MVVASIVNSAFAILPASSVSPEPSNFEKRPRTVEMAMCFTEKPTCVWVVSSFHFMVLAPEDLRVR